MVNARTQRRDRRKSGRALAADADAARRARRIALELDAFVHRECGLDFRTAALGPQADAETSVTIVRLKGDPQGRRVVKEQFFDPRAYQHGTKQGYVHWPVQLAGYA